MISLVYGKAIPSLRCFPSGHADFVLGRFARVFRYSLPRRPIEHPAVRYPEYIGHNRKGRDGVFLCDFLGPFRPCHDHFVH